MLISSVAVLGLLFIAGCGSNDSESADTQPTGSQAQEAQPGHSDSDNAEGTDGNGSGDGDSDQRDGSAFLAAAKTALDEVPKGTVIEIESEEDGAYWEIEVATSDGQIHKMEVSADGSEVERGPRKSRQNSQSKSKSAKRVKAAAVDYAKAYEIIRDARDGKIVELELDEHRGKVVWEADVMKGGTEYEVTVDARNGKVLENEAD